MDKAYSAAYETCYNSLCFNVLKEVGALYHKCIPSSRITSYTDQKKRIYLLLLQSSMTRAAMSTINLSVKTAHI